MYRCSGIPRVVSRPQRESVRAEYHRGSAVPSRQVLRDARHSPRLPRAVCHDLLVRPFAAIFPAICVSQPQTFRYLSPGGHVRRARFRRNSRSANRVDCACIRRLGRRGSKFRKPADISSERRACVASNIPAASSSSSGAKRPWRHKP